MSPIESCDTTLWWGIDIRTGVVTFDNLSWLNDDYKLNKKFFFRFFRRCITNKIFREKYSTRCRLV